MVADLLARSNTTAMEVATVARNALLNPGSSVPLVLQLRGLAATTVTTTAVMAPLLLHGLVVAALVTTLTAREAMEAAQVLLHGRPAATHPTAMDMDMIKAVLPELLLLA